MKAKVMEIKLSKGAVAIMDSYDYHKYGKRHKWYLSGGGYAARQISIGKKANRLVFLHHFVLGMKRGFEVDHINGNKLDNRRCNLRFATRQQNQFNKPKYKNCKSKYKGVTFHKRKTGKQWQAAISMGGKSKYLGIFYTEEEARSAYNAAAKKVHGEFFNPNNRAQILGEQGAEE